MKNRVQLIAYANRLGGTLAGLRELLGGPLSGLFGGIHLLPFFERPVAAVLAAMTILALIWPVFPAAWRWLRRKAA